MQSIFRDSFKTSMEQLTQEVNETSLLGVIVNNKSITIYSVESGQDLQARSKEEFVRTKSARHIVGLA